MRYLFIDGQLNAGGAERVLLDILNHFDYDKHDVTLLQVIGGGTLADEIPAQVNVISAWSSYDNSYKIATRLALKLGIKSIWRNRLLKSLNEAKFDVAISFLEGMPLKAHSLITDVAEQNYSWVHVDLFTSHYESPMFASEQDELECYNKMDGVIAVAQGTADAFKQRFPSCISPVKVIYNPIDVEKINRMAFEEAIENKTFTIAVVGRISPPKKLDRVIRLARRLKDSKLDVQIQLIGDGNLRGELEQMAQALEVTDIVQFLGFKRNPYPYIKAADLLLSTSGWEGFSLVICEAMALGTPVVATRTAGPTEIIGENEYGVLCEHDDDSIFKAVKNIIIDVDMYKHYSRKGLQRVQLFSPSNLICKLEDLGR